MNMIQKKIDHKNLYRQGIVHTYYQNTKILLEVRFWNPFPFLLFFFNYFPEKRGLPGKARAGWYNIRSSIRFRFLVSSWKTVDSWNYRISN